MARQNQINQNCQAVAEQFSSIKTVISRVSTKALSRRFHLISCNVHVPKNEFDIRGYPVTKHHHPLHHDAVSHPHHSGALPHHPGAEPHHLHDKASAQHKQNDHVGHGSEESKAHNRLASEAAHVLSSPPSAHDKAKKLPIALADAAVTDTGLHKVNLVPGHALDAPTTAPAKPKETSSHKLDSTKSLTELAASGAIVDKAPKTNDQVVVPKSTDTSPPKITIEMQNLQKPTDAQFVIKENGQIEMHGDPEKLKSKSINVVLERHDGQLNPTDAQSKAANELTTYLSERVKAELPPAQKNNVVLDDQADVVSPRVQHAQHLRAPHSLSNMTPETQRSVQDMHRFNGSDGVDMPHAATENMGSFDTRNVPRMHGESERQMGIKEAIAGLWKPDHDHPYETIRRHPDGGIRVGRYGFSGHQLNGFLDGLGNPPDPALIEKLIAEGKLPKDFGEKLKDPKYLNELKDFANKLDKGIEPGKDELRNLLPNKTQEALASMMVDQLKQKVGDNPGAIAAGALSGKAPDQVTQQDLTSPSGKQLMNAGQQLFDVATNRQITEEHVKGVIPKSERIPLIKDALEKTDTPVTSENIAAINYMIANESSWKADNVNHWDSNARRGTPSKGLMQTIEPTFRSYSLPGHKNIFDPTDNIIAGIRYAKARYGSLQNVPGVRNQRHGYGYEGY
jgi:Transglycosylase SLT domain